MSNKQGKRVPAYEQMPHFLEVLPETSGEKAVVVNFNNYESFDPKMKQLVRDQFPHLFVTKKVKRSGK